MGTNKPVQKSNSRFSRPLNIVLGFEYSLRYEPMHFIKQMNISIHITYIYISRPFAEKIFKIPNHINYRISSSAFLNT